MNLAGINLLAVLVCGIVWMALGMLWYSPLLFARPWTVAMGYNPDDREAMNKMRQGAGPMYGAAFVASLLSAALLAKLLTVLWISSPLYGMKIGAAVWLGFVATVQLTGTLFGKRNPRVFFIDTGYQLAGYLATGALLAVWH